MNAYTSRSIVQCYDGKFTVFLYTYECMGNNALHDAMLKAEDDATADGYTINMYQGDGLISGVEFDHIEDAIQFKLTYL